MISKWDIKKDHVFMVREDNEYNFRTGTCLKVVSLQRRAHKFGKESEYPLLVEAQPVEWKNFAYRFTKGSESLLWSIDDFIFLVEKLPELDISTELYEALRTKGYESREVVFPRTKVTVAGQRTDKEDAVISTVGIFPRVN